MSLSSRRELVTSIRPRYALASRSEKSTILSEFTAATGLHRKYAVTLLKVGDSAQSAVKAASRARRYDVETQAALVAVWEAANRICSKRLVPFLPSFCEALMRHGRLPYSDAVRDNLMRISPATVDRILKPVRAAKIGYKRQDATHKIPSLRKRIPVRTFTEWTDAKPGDCEADLVAHCGTSMGGSFLYSLTVTDVATAWTECTALLFRDQHTTRDGLTRIRNQMPVRMRSFDTDNGTEFINDVIFAYCEKEGIQFTRSRPYKKNDQCFIEQKNGNVVRRNIGYDRFEGMIACRALNELYSVLRLYVNFFQPSVKLVDKTRDGSKTTRRYDAAQTPYQRVMASSAISTETKVRLKTAYIALDPLNLLQRLRDCQDRLWAMAIASRTARTIGPCSMSSPIVKKAAPGKEPNDIKGSAAVSATESLPEENVHWRKTRKKYKRQKGPRTWRTRPDPFALVWNDVTDMLNAAPNQSTKMILLALQCRYPGVFPDAQLRTLQRQIHRWRVQQTLVAIPLDVVTSLPLTVSDTPTSPSQRLAANV